MFRSQFTNILQHFTNTLGAEDNGISFFTKTSTGEMGLGGEKLQFFKTCIAIVLINTGDTIKTTQGKQDKTINASLRTAEPDLSNKYFYYRNKRYKVLERRDINGTLNGRQFFHYDIVEG